MMRKDYKFALTILSLSGLVLAPVLSLVVKASNDYMGGVALGGGLEGERWYLIAKDGSKIAVTMSEWFLSAVLVYTFVLFAFVSLFGVCFLMLTYVAPWAKKTSEKMLGGKK